MRPWSTVASTPALQGARAGRIEERIPWGAGLERKPDGPVLVDEAGSASPIAQLPLAYLPMDGRAGLSLTGLIRGADGSVRVGTHTLLLDRPVFDAIAGFPLGLFAPGTSGVEPAHWFLDFRRRPVQSDGGLEPLRIPRGASRSAFEAARLSAVARLSGWMGGRMGESAARSFLAAVYDGLVRASESGAFVTLDPGDYDGDQVAWARNAVLLAWLTLPLEDRYRTYFSSDGTDAAFARPLLVATTDPGTRRATGRASISVGPGGKTSRRFSDWARSAMAGGAAFGAVSRRVDIRRQSLLAPRLQCGHAITARCDGG